MAKKSTSALLITLISSLLLIAPAHAEEPKLPFPDVEEDTKYYDAIEYLYNEGTVSGYSDGTFKPDQEVNRVEALKILLLNANIESDSENTSIFSDVEGTEWFFPYIAEGIDRKIISGYEDGTFKPDETVNLVEMLKIFVNTNELIPTLPGEDDEFFEDAEKDAWYSGYLNFAYENALVYANSENLINPDSAITRADLAYIIYRYKNSSYFSGETGFGKATYYADMFEGLNTANGEMFDQNKMTAAHLTLPFDTTVRVTNLDNGKTVEVRINDRGPYAEGHVIDLSKTAFQKLGRLSQGVMNVEYEIVYPES